MDRRLDWSHRRGSSRGREGETMRSRGRKGERETMRPGEDEKNKNKIGIKNYKEIIFK